MRKRGVAIAMIAMVGIVVVGIVACFAGAVAQYDGATFSLDSLFLPDSNAIVQVMVIACMSSWAFIGFEGVSHQSGEFAFARKHTFKVFAISLAIITALYIFVTVLSVLAYPTAGGASYANWNDYIGDIGNLNGILGIPPFFVAQYYLGDAGVIILMVVLLCLVFTSLIGIMSALTRLVFSLAKDKILPEQLAATNENGVPSRVIAAIVLVSMVIPFFGRTAVGWIVDVTTIGAVVVYGFVSACALKEGRQSKNTLEADCGLVGLVLMIAFALYLMVPGFFANGSMGTQTYFLFAIWSLLGFVFFRHLLRTDESRRFGNSIVAWALLLCLTLFSCLAWMGQMSDEIVGATVGDLHAYYTGEVGAQVDPAREAEVLDQAVSSLDGSITLGMFVISGALVFSLVTMLSNFATMRRREEHSYNEANVANTIANTDSLTGVKSKNAYVSHEAVLNDQLEDGTLGELGIVVCDVNGLKQVNDSLGHKAGDEYILAASKFICEFYKHSPVFRIGGDEFVVTLQGVDYANRNELLDEMNAKAVENRDNGSVVVSAGMSIFNASIDKDIHAVFERADAAMYQRKRILKGGVPGR